MKRFPILLSILFLLAVGACTLKLPGAEAPTAIVSITEPPSVAITEPSATATPTPLPAYTPTAPQPTVAPPTAEPSVASPVPATQTPQSAASQTMATQLSPTATASPVPTSDPYRTYGEPDYENPMRFANFSEWAQAGTQTLPDTRNIRLQFKDGNLYVTGKRLNFSTWWFSYHTLSDAYIEMTFDSEDCSGEDAYGIIFRGPPHLAGISYGYVVSFTCDGRLWIFRLDDADPWETEVLIDEETVSAIHIGPYEQNVIGVQAEGDQFVIFANGIQVAELEDNHFEKGRLGVFVRAAKPHAYTYRVKNFAYWILGEDE